MPRYKTKLTGAIVHNTLTNKTELKYYYNDKETGRAVYTNKGSMPMDIYLTISPTYTFTVDKEFLNAVKEELTGKSKNKAYQEDGSIILFGT